MATEGSHMHGGVQESTSFVNVMIIVVAGLGSFMSGYANNAIAGSFAQVSFGAKFLSGSNADSIINGMLGVFYSGGLIGAIIQAPLSNRYGRRAGSLVGGILLVVSGVIQAGSVHIAMFLVGRFICGVASGIIISNCAVYMSEVSPPHNRGRLVSIHAITLVSGYVISSIFALAFYFVEASYQWRLQFVMLTFFAVLLVISFQFLPESPRWLVEKEMYDAAWKVLERIHRSPTDPSATMAHAKMIQIRAQVDSERGLPTGYIHIFMSPSLRRRAIISILMWCMGQGSGVLVIANLTPLLFKSLGFSIVQQLGLSIAWVSRVKLLVIGGYLCAMAIGIEAALQKYYLGTDNKSGLNAAVGFFFAFIILYGLFVDAPVFTYVADIWPTHLRSQGATIGLVSFFANTIAYTSSASTGLTNLGWKYYMIFVTVCTTCATAIAFLAPETARLTLEEIGATFGDKVEVVFGNFKRVDNEKVEDELVTTDHVEISTKISSM